MQIFIFSDTHGKISLAADVIRQNRPDYVVHLGDCVSDAHEISGMFPGLRVTAVAGNNDFYECEPEEKAETLFGRRFFITHGHRYKVRRGIDLLLSAGLRAGAHVVLFGHTHVPFAKKCNEIFVLNPGSISLPRHGARTYGVISIEEGIITGEIVPV